MSVYFSGSSILGGCQSARGVKLIFPSSPRLQCTILQQNGKFSNILAFLLGALLYPNDYNRRRLDRSIL